MHIQEVEQISHELYLWKKKNINITYINIKNMNNKKNINIKNLLQKYS